MLGLGDLEVRGKCIDLNSLPHPHQDDPHQYKQKTLSKHSEEDNLFIQLLNILELGY